MHTLSLRSTPSGANRLFRTPVSSVLLASALVLLGACTEDTPADPIRVATMEVTPRLSTARVGATQQLAAVAKDASGNPMSETITWKSAEPSVATVSPTGLVTRVGSGSTAILASARGTSGFATIVSDANVATVAIFLPSGVAISTASLQIALTLQLQAAAQDPAGISLFRPVTWTSSDPTVATVSATGLVTAIGLGPTTITATSEGRSTTATITIIPPAPVATISFTPNSGFMPTTIGVPLALVLRDAANVILTGRVVAWTTSNAAVATVSGTGVVTGVASGTVTITATSEGRSAAATFTVLPGLRSGTGVTYTNPTVNTSAFFAVYVPAGSTNLGVTIRNGNGDPDLYVYRPGQNTPACASENGGATVVEDCVLASPLAGVWVIEVYAFTPHAGTTVTATVTPTPP
ncbi:MAG: Ig-like domain-containing protein [Gemmatimonas sp.]